MFIKDKLRNRSLASLLVWPFLFLFLITVSIIGYLTFSNARHAVNLVAGELRREMVNHIKSHLHQFLSAPRIINRLNADALGQGVLDPTSQERIISHFWRQIQIFDSVTSIYFGNNKGGLATGGREGAGGELYIISTPGFVSGTFEKYSTDPKGKPVDKIFSMAGFDARSRPWYKAAEQKKAGAWSDIYILFTGTDMAIAPSRPVYDEQGKMLGVVATDIFLSHISTFLEKLHKNRPGVAYIIEKSGLLIASSVRTPLFSVGDEHRPKTRFGDWQSSNPLIRNSALFLRNQFADLSQISQNRQFSLTMEGTPYFLEVAPFDDPDGLSWLIVTATPQSAFLEKIYAGNQQTFWLVSLALLIAALMAFRISRWITHPLRALNQSAKIIATGELSHRIPIQREDEVGELANSFNKMAAQLETSFKHQRQILEELSQSNRELSESLDFSKTVISKSPAGILIYMDEGGCLDANQAAATMIGATIPQLLKQNFQTIESWKRCGLYEMAERTLAENCVNRIEVDVISTFGKHIRIDCQLVPFKIGDEKLLMVTFTDITEWRKVEKELRSEQLLMNATLDALNDTFFLFNPQTGKSLRWNRQFNRVSGYSNQEIFQLKAPDSYYSPDDIKEAASTIEKVLTGEKQIVELPLICKNGSRVFYEYSVSLVETPDEPLIISIGRDISERKLMEAKARQSQKMEALGTLSGGIAHDFNNILGIITGNAELITMDKSDPAQGAENILTASKRAKTLIHQLMTFSRGSQIEKQAFKPIQLIQEALQLLRSTLPSTITIQESLNARDCAILGNPSQFNQLLMNLCTNAGQAMGEKGGLLLVSLEQVELEASRATSLNIKPGNYLQLIVCDSGPGMSKETLARLFDPFFTTKRLSHGTGLGLSVVHGIVKESGGAIQVESEVEMGSVFTVFFPITDHIPDEVVEKIPQNFAAKDQHGSILFVDDEPSMMDVGIKMLEAMGYSAEGFTDPIKALEQFKKSPDHFDAVITDQIMPGLSGTELAVEVLKIDPKIPLILCTGYSEKVTEESARKLGFKRFFQKPVIMSDLSQALKEIIPTSVRKKLHPEQAVEPSPAPDRHLLIVDDDYKLLRLYKKFLEKMGELDAETVSDGQTALERLQEEPDRFDFLVIDLNLPGQSGLEVAKQAKKSNPNLGILLWSGLCDKSLEEKAKLAGVDLYTEKPNSFLEFSTLMKKLIKTADK